jgi:hypothetical protein
MPTHTLILRPQLPRSSHTLYDPCTLSHTTSYCKTSLPLPTSSNQFAFPLGSLCLSISTSYQPKLDLPTWLTSHQAWKCETTISHTHSSLSLDSDALK